MRKFLQNCIILFLLAVLAGVSIGITEVANPGFALFAIGYITIIAMVVWVYLEKAHEIVVRGMRHMLGENVIGLLNLKEEPRCRGSTANYFLRRFTPAKVNNSQTNVKSSIDFNIITLHKGDPVRSNAVFELGYENNPAEYIWLHSMKDEELHLFLDYCVQNRIPTGIKYALNILKARAKGERLYSASNMAQIGGPNYQSKRKVVLC